LRVHELAAELGWTSRQLPHVEELRAGHHRAIATVFRRAVRSGKVRVDASPVDLAVLLIANAGLIHRTVDDAPRSSARLVALWLAGVISHANVEAPPAPTESEIRRALNNCGAAQPRTAASGSLSPLARQGPSSSNDHENRCR
jgi:hypothetical protein